MLSGEQILHEIVTTFIRIAPGAGEMMIDSDARRSAEIIRNGKNFVGRFTLVEQPLRVRTRRADRKQLRRGTDESGKEQLFAIEFWTEARHRMKQSAREPFARSCHVVDVTGQAVRVTPCVTIASDCPWAAGNGYQSIRRC